MIQEFTPPRRRFGGVRDWRVTSTWSRGHHHTVTRINSQQDMHVFTIAFCEMVHVSNVKQRHFLNSCFFRHTVRCLIPLFSALHLSLAFCLHNLAAFLVWLFAPTGTRLVVGGLLLLNDHRILTQYFVPTYRSEGLTHMCEKAEPLWNSSSLFVDGMRVSDVVSSSLALQSNTSGLFSSSARKAAFSVRQSFSDIQAITRSITSLT